MRCTNIFASADKRVTWSCDRCGASETTNGSLPSGWSDGVTANEGLLMRHNFAYDLCPTCAPKDGSL